MVNSEGVESSGGSVLFSSIVLSYHGSIFSHFHCCKIEKTINKQVWEFLFVSDKNPNSSLLTGIIYRVCLFSADNNLISKNSLWS